MWTQSKNKFNNDYQLQMLHPIPIHCDAATAQGFSDCAFLSEAGAERIPDLMQQCSAGNEGRCLGWELIKIANKNNIHGPKFQWRHSCREDGSGCTHLMMHADVSIVLWGAFHIQISTSTFRLFSHANSLFYFLNPNTVIYLIRWASSASSMTPVVSLLALASAQLKTKKTRFSMFRVTDAKKAKYEHTRKIASMVTETQ